jgi:hypothetical protein
MAKKYVRFDEIENVLSSLTLLVTLAPLVKKRRGLQFWKWIIVGAHDALQGAIVCAIADTTGTNVLSKTSACKMWAWLQDTSEPYPGEYMADFGTLLSRIGFDLLPPEEKAIRRLHSLRNGFMHFTPKSWSIELAGLPKIIGAVVDVVEKLMTNDRLLCRLTGNRQRSLKSAIDAIRKHFP